MGKITVSMYKYIKRAIDLIYKNKSTRGRKCEFSIDHYISKIFFVLSSLKSWKDLDENNIYDKKKAKITKHIIKSRNGIDVKNITRIKKIRNKRKKIKQLSSDAYRKKFNMWSNDGVFKLAYELFLKDICRNNNVNITNFLIDSKNIQNMNGTCKEAEYAHKIKSKRSIKLTAIVNENKIPFAFVISKGNKHDSKITIEAINSFIIPVGFCKYNEINLVGDSAYQNKKHIKECKDKFGINLLVKPRKNAKEKPVFTEKQEIVIEKRAYIEHFFSDISRNYAQVCMKYASTISRYLSFVFMASLNCVARNFLKEKCYGEPN